MAGLLFVCVRCHRYADARSDAAGAGLALAESLAALGGHALEVRQVACLGGCPRPCNVALRGRARPSLLFSGVDVTDGAALIEFATAYWALTPGGDVLTAVPPTLRAKLTRQSPPLAGASLS